MIRREILDMAETCVCGQREEDYGTPEDNFKVIADLWSCWLNEKITPHDVAIMMTLLKIGRMKSGKIKDDNYVDGCGYLACAAEIGLSNPEMQDAPIRTEPIILSDDDRSFLTTAINSGGINDIQTLTEWLNRRADLKTPDPLAK